MKIFTTLTQPGIHRSHLIRKTVATILFLTAGAIGIHDRLHASTAVVVFARPVAAGVTIESADLRLIHVPPNMLPDDAITNVSEAIGRISLTVRPAHAMVTRHDFVDLSLVSSRVTKNTDENTHAQFNMVPITLADPTIAGLLQPGDEISIITTSHSDSSPQLIAAGGKVIFAISNDSDFPGAVPGTILVTLPDHDAQIVAAASLEAPLAVILTGERAK